MARDDGSSPPVLESWPEYEATYDEGRSPGSGPDRAGFAVTSVRIVADDYR